MSLSFRTAVFNLCKKCITDSHSLEIRETIQSISKSDIDVEGNQQRIQEPSHGDLAYISSHKRIQFLGYLLTDESVDSINKTPPFHATHLSSNERQLIEMAHLTVSFFIDSCLEMIKQKYPKSSLLLDPYANYVKPLKKTDAKSFLKKEDIIDCVKAFEASELYKMVAENDALVILEKVSEESIRKLGAVIDRQLQEGYSDPNGEMVDLLNNVSSPSISGSDILMVHTLYCYALQKSLENASQMIFEAILGIRFVVLNNDNIISIDSEEHSNFYYKHTVLCQDVEWGLSGSIVGSIILFDCVFSDATHVREFGKVVSETISYSREFGESMKISFVTVDDDINPIHSLTNRILKSKAGKMPVKIGFR
jgi:hypothetical protein